MKALILSAGQGKRLLPHTAMRPKCLLPVGEKALIHWQLDALSKAGCREVVVVVGFGAEQVEEVVARRPDADRIRTVFNPFYALSNNLASCWVARAEMEQDFLLLNGDVVFEEGVVERLLHAAEAPVTLAVTMKTDYDDDDMKVRLSGRRLLRVGKDLPADEIDAEAIGVHAFRTDGPALFREALERAMRDPAGLKRFYLTAIGELARTHHVATASIEGLEWGEVDTPEDLDAIQGLVGRWRKDLSKAPV